MKAPIFRALDGSLWVWNQFRSELQELHEPPEGNCGAVDCVNGCDGAPDLCPDALKAEARS